MIILKMFLRMVIPFWCVLCVLPASAWGQVEELWRVQWTNSFNPPLAYRIKWAATDPADNLYLAGTRSTGFQKTKNFVRKISPEGILEWETVVSTNNRVAMNFVTADAKGNSYATVQPYYNDNWHLDLVKLLPTGQVIWRQTEDSFSNPGDTSYPFHCILPGSQGEIYFLSARLQADETIGLQLAKFNSGGRILWRKRIPIVRCYLGLGGLARALSFTPEGDVVLTTGALPEGEDVSARRAIVAKYGWDGRLRWLNTYVQEPFGSVSVSTNGNICAAGSTGFVVINPQGTTLRDEGTYYGQYTVMKPSKEGAFPVRWSGGYHWIFLKPDGTNQGRGFGGFDYAASSIVSDGEGGWISIGRGSWEQPPWSAVTRFTAFDSMGNQKWHHVITNHIYTGTGNIDTSWLFMGADKRLRVVAPLDTPHTWSSSRGFGITAFSLTTNRPPIWILSGPEDVVWDGHSDVTMNVSATGEESPVINWNRDPQPFGGLQSTLLIQSTDVQYMYGLIGARASIGTNFLYSRIAELRLNRMLWQTTPPDSFGAGVFRVAADWGTFFQIQQSTNLMDWSLRWPSVFNGSATFGINQDDGEKLFFRAVQVPRP